MTCLYQTGECIDALQSFANRIPLSKNELKSTCTLFEKQKQVFTPLSKPKQIVCPLAKTHPVYPVNFASSLTFFTWNSNLFVLKKCFYFSQMVFEWTHFFVNFPRVYSSLETAPCIFWLVRLSFICRSLVSIFLKYFISVYPSHIFLDLCFSYSMAPYYSTFHFIMAYNFIIC